MIDIKELEHLAPMANEMLSGLHADEAMKRRILFAANEKAKRRAPMPRLVPALCCAALAIACVSAFAPRLSGTAVDAAATPMPVSIDSIAAGGEQTAPMTRVADVSGTARVRAAGGAPPDPPSPTPPRIRKPARTPAPTLTNCPSTAN